MLESLTTRRAALKSFGVALALIPLPQTPARAAARATAALTAYRNPGCGCCEKWAALLRAKGFVVDLIDDPDLDARRSSAGVPAPLAGCHTAIMGDYVIEGHVPAEDIERFLAEKPEARGLAVAGMPLGSPGMEMNGEKEPYDVMLFTADGKWKVFASH